MAYGIYETKLKNGTPSFRVGFYHDKKHISVGSYRTSEQAQEALEEATRLYEDSTITIDNFREHISAVTADKAVSIINHRDNKVYFRTPIYLMQGYFLYFMKGRGIIKFDNDDLFYYSTHRILLHDGHLYVNDYGSQYSLFSRYGIRNYAVQGKDYEFANGDPLDLRYENVIVINPYNGVRILNNNGMIRFETKIHVNGYILIGRYRSLDEAAIAYNKAVDYLKSHGSAKNYVRNYITDLSSEDYKKYYDRITLPVSLKQCLSDDQ